MRCFWYSLPMQHQHAHLPETLDALRALGAQVAAGRRRLGWTAAELGERIGASKALVSRIEKGAPGVSIGTALEAAVVCGVPLFGATDPGAMRHVADDLDARLALLPARVRHRDEPEFSSAF